MNSVPFKHTPHTDRLVLSCRYLEVSQGCNHMSYQTQINKCDNFTDLCLHPSLNQFKGKMNINMSNISLPWSDAGVPLTHNFKENLLKTWGRVLELGISRFWCLDCGRWIIMRSSLTIWHFCLEERCGYDKKKCLLTWDESCAKGLMGDAQSWQVVIGWKEYWVEKTNKTSTCL